VSTFRILVTALCATAGISAFTSAQSLSLAQMQTLALRNNPAGLQAEALRQLGRAEISVARAWSDPLVEGLIGRGEPLGTDVSKQESGFQVSQELPSPIAYRHRIQAAEFGSAEREAQAFARRLDLLFEVELLFHEHAAAAEGARLLAENAEGAQRVLALVSRRAELGEARETERIRVEVELLRQQRALAAARREAEVTRDALFRIVGPGIPEGATVEAAWPEVGSVGDLESLRTRLAARNPELSAAQARVDQSAESASAAAWGAWPDLKATYYDLREIDKKAQGAKLEIAVPLWNANRPETARRRAEESIFRAELKQLEIALANDLDRAYREFRLSAEQSEIFLRRLLPAAREGLRLIELTYEEGETSFLDLLDAQRTYREAAAESVALHRDAARALATIHRLTGGTDATDTR
jgi:cobalt-zinc-cadmium efflux system outer membrane protein